MMFSGFRSRCTMPAACASARPLGDLGGDLQELLASESGPCDEHLAQRLAVDELHRDVGDASARPIS